MNPPQLDRRKLLPTESGGFRDWRGLAELAGFAGDVAAFELRPRPTIELIKQWCRRPGVTVRTLTDMLAQMDRDDVLDDAAEALANDCQKALTQVGMPFGGD